MSAIDIDAIRARWAKWHPAGTYFPDVVRADIAALLAEVARLRAVVAEYDAAHAAALERVGTQWAALKGAHALGQARCDAAEAADVAASDTTAREEG